MDSRSQVHLPVTCFDDEELPSYRNVCRSTLQLPDSDIDRWIQAYVVGLKTF